jgi:hypothetical protein|tara:strand:- start:1067 stop:1600 length:534 start_codon:yes stop_codon:yes gene_type:complete
MKNQIKAAYHDVLENAKELRNVLIDMHVDFDKFVVERLCEEEELVDLGIIGRDLESLLDELRKEVKARKELVSKVLAVAITKDALNNPHSDVRATGTLGTATPDVKVQPILPKRSDAKYADLLKHFGVNEEAINRGLLSVHWVKFGDYLTELTREGKNAPLEIESKAVPTVTFRKKR